MLIALLTLISLPVCAQNAGSAVVGYRGTIELSRSASGLETRIAFTSDTDFPNGAKEAVFVLQHASDAGTLDRSRSRGRLLISRGVLAVIAENGANRLFKFPDLPVPESLKWTDFTIIPVIGISQYYKTENNDGRSALTIEELRNSPASVEPCPATCDSGGKGSTACAVTSGDFACTVSCAVGFHACCSSSQPKDPRCTCCKD